MALNQPSFIDNPWATNGTKTTIPATQATPGDGSASWDKGFPPETAIPISQGGVPPRYVDFNGVLNSLSSFAWWQQRGGLFGYSNTIDYPVGAIVISGGKTYQCLAENGPGTTAGVKAVTNTSYWLPSETSTSITGLALVKGCAVFASGLKLQWGQESPTAQLEVTFSAPFDYSPVVVLTPNAAFDVWVTGLSATSFKINASVYNSNQIRWLAIGV